MSSLFFLFIVVTLCVFVENAIGQVDTHDVASHHLRGLQVLQQGPSFHRETLPAPALGFEVSANPTEAQIGTSVTFSILFRHRYATPYPIKIVGLDDLDTSEDLGQECGLPSRSLAPTMVHTCHITKTMTGDVGERRFEFRAYYQVEGQFSAMEDAGATVFVYKPVFVRAYPTVAQIGTSVTFIFFRYATTSPIRVVRLVDLDTSEDLGKECPLPSSSFTSPTMVNFCNITKTITGDLGERRFDFRAYYEVVKKGFSAIEVAGDTVSVYKPLLAFSASNGVGGPGLWVTDGSSEGTKLVKDISHGGLLDHTLTSFGDQIIFAGNGRNGAELWKSDGSAKGTVMVKDFYPGPGISIPVRFTVFKDRVYFAAASNSQTSFIDLWVTDGTQGGTERFKPNCSGFSEFAVVGDKLFFGAYSGLWVIQNDRTRSRVNGDYAYGYTPRELTSFQDRLYFQAFDSAHGRELWSSDGSRARRMTDIAEGRKGSLPRELTVYNHSHLGGVLFFVAGNGQGQYELRVTHQGHYSSSIKSFQRPPKGLTVAGRKLFFSADEGELGRELWVTTPETLASTHLVKDINSGFSGSDPGHHSHSIPREFASFRDNLFFSADNGIHGRELWRSDGSRQGTIMVKDIKPGAEGSFPRNLVVFQDQLFFSAASPYYGEEPWVTDGTSQGTRMVKDILPGEGSSKPAGFTPLRYFGE